MSKILAKFEILGAPRVKKNNQTVVVARSRSGGRYARKIDTKAYKKWRDGYYDKNGKKHVGAIVQIEQQKPQFEIDRPVNLKCTFYMDTNGKVDLSALYEGIQDELVKCNVLSDDNYTIVQSHDGSRVYVDPANPRMEIEITEAEL